MPTNPTLALPNWVKNDCGCKYCRFWRRFHITCVNRRGNIRRFLSAYYSNATDDDYAVAAEIILSEDFDFDKYDRAMRRVNISNTAKRILLAVKEAIFDEQDEFDRTITNDCNCCGTRHSQVFPGSDPLINTAPEMVEYFRDHVPTFCSECWAMGAITFCRHCHTYGFSRLFYDDGRTPEDIQSRIIFAERTSGFGSVSRCNECSGIHTPDEAIVACHECGILLTIGSDDYYESALTREGDRFCYNCQESSMDFWRCNRCGTCYSDPSTRSTYSGLQRTCTQCVTNIGVSQCENCHRHILGNDPLMCSCNHYIINNYTHKPEPIFFYNTKRERRNNTTFYGMELEFSPPGHGRIENEKAVGFMYKKIPLLGNASYVKNDATTQNGFEFVTHPFSYDWLVQKDQVEMFYNFFQYIVGKFGYHGANRHCGMHVHVSRTGFSGSTLYKLMRMLYGYPLFAERVAGRTVADMQRYANLAFGGGKEIYERTKGGRFASGGDRGAVNLRNTNTIELRLFRGVNSADDMYRNMEYIDSLRTYISSCSLMDATPYKFKEWILTGKTDNMLVKDKYSRVANHLRNFAV